MNKLQKRLVLGVALTSPVSAFAVVDVTAISAIIPDVTAIGVAVFAVIVAIKAVKMIRRAV